MSAIAGWAVVAMSEPPEDPKKTALYESAEWLARSRIRLDGLTRAVGDTHPMRVEEQRIHDERRTKFLVLYADSGLKLDRDELLRAIGPVMDPQTRDDAVRALTLAILLEASASDPPKNSEPG